MVPKAEDYMPENGEEVETTVNFVRITFIGSWFTILGFGIGIIFLVMPVEFNLNYSKTAALPLNGFL